MAVDAGGIVIFLLCVFVGPVCLGVYEIYQKQRVSTAAAPQMTTSEQNIVQNENGRELVTKTEYLLGLLGYAIGIGNLWRFPFLCGRNGGAAFLVAYFFCLFFVSLPAYMIEMVMGQYTRQTTIGCFTAVHPVWRGVGWAQAFMLFFVLAYYNVVLTYACIYVIGSLSSPFPWAPENGMLGGDSSALYWNEGVLNRFKSLDGNGLGPVQWELALGLLVVWTMVFFSLAFGKQALAKVTWVTVVMPLALLVILIFRVAFLEASDEGVAFYIGKFDIEKLSEIGVWRDACVQILFSLSPGMGTAITMSSYTKPRENVYKTCWIVAICNSAFSFFGGFAIFSIVGNITYKINLQTLKEQLVNVNRAIENFSTAFGTDGAFGSAVETAKKEMKKVDLGAVSNAGLKVSAAEFMRTAVVTLQETLSKGDSDDLSKWAIANQGSAGLTDIHSALTLQEVSDTAKGGPGLAFIAIADGMQTFGGAQNIMAVLFFLTLLTLGLDSTFAWAETWVSYVDDTFRTRGKPQKKIVCTAIVSGILFLLGLPFCTRMGNEFLDTVDNYVGLMFLLFGVFIEGILFMFCFGYKRFEDAVRTACGVEFGPIQKAYWLVTTHFTMWLLPLLLFIYDVYTLGQDGYGGYPTWMQGIGWFLLFVCIILIPIGAVIGYRMGGSKLDEAPGAIIAQECISCASGVQPETVGVNTTVDPSSL